MKKFLLAILLLLAMAGSVWAAGASTTMSHTAYSVNDEFKRCVVTLTFTADDTTAAFTSYVLAPTALTKVHANFGIQGWYLWKVRVNPGSTGPTNGAWDLDITNTSGYLVSRNLLDDQSATVTNEATIVAPFDETWTVSIADNAVNSATVVVKLIFLSD